MAININAVRLYWRTHTRVMFGEFRKSKLTENKMMGYCPPKQGFKELDFDFT